MVTVVNNTNQSHMLDDGTIIGAAHTKTARRDGVTLTEADRKRLVEPGHLSFIEAPASPAAPAASKSPTTQHERTPEPAENKQVKK